MIPAESPEKLLDLTSKWAKRGAKGVLISGGYSREGKVPLRRFIKALREIKRLGLVVAVHTGLVSKEDAENLRAAEVDAALIDIVGDDDTVREMLGLNAKASDFFRSVVALKEAQLFVAPHIVIGLNHGSLKGELDALKKLSEIGIEALSFLVYSPTPGTPSAFDLPPKLEDIAMVITTARKTFFNVYLTLGCMKPRGEYRSLVDQVAVLCGVNGIVNPSLAALKLAERLGLNVKKIGGCCVFRS